jgi:hypothetical protein
VVWKTSNTIPVGSARLRYGLKPIAYVTATLSAIVNGHKQSRVYELFPWKWTDTAI